MWLIFGVIHGLNTKNSQKLLDNCQKILDVLVCKCPAQSRAVWKLPKSNSVFIRLSNGVSFVSWWMMIQPPDLILCGYFFLFLTPFCRFLKPSWVMSAGKQILSGLKINKESEETKSNVISDLWEKFSDYSCDRSYLKGRRKAKKTFKQGWWKKIK